MQLLVKRQGGGSIIDHRPLFSHDGETLYVIWKQVIRTYSAQTGDYVREFEPTKNKLIGIASHPNHANIILGCTETGELINWNVQNGLITKNLKLNMPEDTKVKTFHIIYYLNSKENQVCEVLISYIVKEWNAVKLNIFDLEHGNSSKSTVVHAVSGHYDIDTIGNYGDNLVAIVQDINLRILQPSANFREQIHKIGFGGRKFTCVTGHPEDECVATGDSSGRVAVWKNLFNRPVPTSYHWHTLPVTEIRFSTSGSHMYTGGSECVLVKWIVGNPQHKSFLPRLPAPIKHLTIAPENLHVAVSTVDNGIIIVNNQRQPIAVIQNFTWGVSPLNSNLFPAGLVLDPRTGCLVLNSRTGCVQFFDTHTKNLLYNVNITAQNFLTQKRDTIIVNTEVTKVALNHDGLWMATIEERDDKISCPEVRLKFWKFNLEKQIFMLNTSIELPHEQGVNALKFQPNVSMDGEDVMVVTVGKDKKFKLWTLEESSSTDNTTNYWRCYGVGFYRDLSAHDAGFAVDGSLLGVSFGSTLTIWIPESCGLKCSLTHSRYSHTLKRIEFGKHEASHLVVAASSEHIAVWNLLTLTIMWSAPLRLATLTADPNSIYMAIFTTDNTLFVFSPQSSKPVYEKKNVLDDNDNAILGAIFIPRPPAKRVPGIKHWQRKSKLYFVDSNQELLTLEAEAEAADSFESLTLHGSLPATAFSSLIAAQVSNNIERTSPFLHEHINTGKDALEDLLTISAAHTLPPMKTLCAQFIMSLRAQTAQIKTTDDKSIKTSNGVHDESEDDGNEKMHKKSSFKNTRSKVTEIKKHNHLKMYANPEDYNWDFLASILPHDDL